MISLTHAAGIYAYKLENTVGWTYQLTIWTTATYDYTFFTKTSGYGLNVFQTWISEEHEVTYTTTDWKITSVSGT